MPAPTLRTAKLGPRLARPFYASTLIITLLATYSLLSAHRHGDGGLHGRHLGNPPGSSALSKRAEDLECRLVHQAKDQCAFILANCQDDEAGLLSYLKLYYCDLAPVQPIAFILLVVWLGLLFTTIGIAASDFFSVNLNTIASILGLSESLAGVTFLAFGNGSPDVFSTFAAMGSNSGSMAVGELIGAAGFITAVVAGSMALVREFKVARRTFVRDVCFFIFAVSFSMVFLADGALHLWECCVMIGFYVFYVIVVVGWHWFSSRRRRRRQKEAASRGHFYGPAAQPNDELEPYRDSVDDEDDDTAPLNGRGGVISGDTAPDISALERGPRIEVSGNADDGDEEEDSDRDLQVAAEMTSSMRVNRPRGARSNTTLGQIRPSFVGALEFRSVLASLQKSGNVRLAPMHSRGYSEHNIRATTSQLATPAGEPMEADLLAVPAQAGGMPSPGRDRALSFGDLPMHWSGAGTQAPEIVTQSPKSPEETRSEAFFAPPSRSGSSKDGSLAPPPDLHRRVEPDTQVSNSLQAATLSNLRLQIPTVPTPQSSGHSSPSLSPFPGLSESPLPMTPNSHSPTLQGAGIRDHPYFGVEIQDRRTKPVRWWPHQVLPPPHVLLSTLFPTLQGWGHKTVWDKFVSLISVPSLFLLVTTLPVVETEANDNQLEDTLADPPRPGEPGNVGTAVSVEPGASIEPETEWQRYRRNTRSTGSRGASGSSTPAPVALGDPLSQLSQLGPALGASVDGARDTVTSQRQQNQPLAQPAKPGPSLSHLESETPTSEEPPAWQRWLVVVQIFTGPLFTTFIIWANMEDDLERPGWTLVRMLLISLVGSLVLLALLLSTTSPDVRPKYHFMFCFLGFVISVAWISTVAGEVVGVLKAFGVILGISEAILGLTIFAVGNSLGDLVADITVARLGYPVMALSACFGGPMLNILLGVGIGGAWMTTQAANKKHTKHPDRPLHYKPYHIQVGGTLLISAVTVLVTLIFLLIAVPSNRWVMSRKIGWSLIAIWSVSTAINLVVELTGFWSDVA